MITFLYVVLHLLFIPLTMRVAKTDIIFGEARDYPTTGWFGIHLMFSVCFSFWFLMYLLVWNFSMRFGGYIRKKLFND